MTRPQLNPSKPAERSLLLPQGESRDEGRLRLPSLGGSRPVSGSLLEQGASHDPPPTQPFETR